VRDDQIRSRLVQSNPWWRTAGDRLAWAVDDRALRSRAAFDLGYRPDVLEDIALGPIGDGLVVLRGPRRVGKSVTVKDAVAQLCGRQDVDPRQIVYLAADAMTAQDLNRVAILGRDLTRSVNPAQRIWLLDEVTGVKGWTGTIKFLRDNTPFGDDTVVCTGSSWDAGAEVERDLFAGRAGTATTRRSRLLLPMSFRDVLAATERDVPAPGPVQPWDLQGPTVATAAAAVELDIDELDLAWQAYLTSGGFPRAVAEHHRAGEVSDAFLSDLVAWLHQDVDPEAPADSVPLLLAGLHQRSSSPLNRAKTATALNYRTRQTFDLRLTRLTRSLAAQCHQVDDEGRRVVGAQSKLYLTDTLLAWLGPRLRAGLPRLTSPRSPRLPLQSLWPKRSTVPSPGGGPPTTPSVSSAPAEAMRSTLRPYRSADCRRDGLYDSTRVQVGEPRLAVRGPGRRRQARPRRPRHPDNRRHNDHGLGPPSPARRPPPRVTPRPASAAGYRSYSYCSLRMRSTATYRSVWETR